jgi:hypothetical protein
LSIAAAFAISAPQAFAATWPVSNRTDYGPGSLRDVVSNPSTLPGDTVDSSQLNTGNALLSHSPAIDAGNNKSTLKCELRRMPGAVVAARNAQ